MHRLSATDLAADDVLERLAALCRRVGSRLVCVPGDVILRALPVEDPAPPPAAAPTSESHAGPSASHQAAPESHATTGKSTKGRKSTKRKARTRKP